MPLINTNESFSIWRELYDEINQLLFGIEPHPQTVEEAPIHLQATYQKFIDENEELDYDSMPGFNKVKNYYNGLDTDNPPSESDLAQKNKDFNICGMNQYVKPSIVRMNEGQEAGDETYNPCASCDVIDETEFYPTFNEQGDQVDSIRPLSEWPSDLPPLDSYTLQCASDHPHLWIPEQHDQNPYMNSLDITWSDISVTESNNNEQYDDLAKKWFTDRLDDGTLTMYMNQHNFLGKSDCNDETLDTEGECFNNLLSFKQQISQGRGSSVSCDIGTDSPEWMGLTDEIDSSYECIDGTIGPHNIIQEELDEWRNDNLYESIEYEEDIQDWSQFWNHIGSDNPEFEQCINEVFTDSNALDQTMIDELQNANSILDLDDTHIQYIRRKLQAFLVDTNQEKLLQCMNLLYINTSVCNAGLTEKMIHIFSVISYIVGYHFSLDDVDNDIHKQKLIEIIDSLGPLVPQVLDKIITLSEAQESQYCDGEISNRTVVLRDLYEQVFTPPNNKVTFDFGIDKLLSGDTSDTEFNRSVVLSGIALAFLKFF